MVSAGFAALVPTLALAVFAAVLWPLRRQSRGLALALGLAGVAAVAALYLWRGTPAALRAHDAVPAASLDAAMARLEQALAENPEQPEGWALLGQAYASRQRPAEAAAAYARAVALAPVPAIAGIGAAACAAVICPSTAPPFKSWPDNTVISSFEYSRLHSAIKCSPSRWVMVSVAMSSAPYILV